MIYKHLKNYNLQKLQINIIKKQKYMKSTLQTIITILCIILQTYCHYIPKITNKPIEIHSYINQAKQIPIPFKKCFQVQTQLSANRKYLNFQPSSLKLSQIRQAVISQDRQISVLQDIRSPSSFIHEHLLVFDTYATTFMAPNTILILKQNQSKHYGVVNRISIEQINQYTQFKMYKFNNQVMMILSKTKPNSQQNKIMNGQSQFTKGYLISQKNYQQLKLPIKKSISHLVSDGIQFFTAQYSDGIGCYSYSQKTKTITKVAQYTAQLFKQNVYIVDINIKSLKSDYIIYALDGFKGVYRINLKQSSKQPKVQLIISQPNCNSLDSISINHIVLVCQLGSVSYIVQAYGKQNDKGQYIFQKLQPQYHVNYFNDLVINKNYFLVFSHRTLNVYWSSKQNNIPETINTRSQLDLPGLETFYCSLNTGPKGQSYLYIIQSGIFKQMLITQSPARLSIKSTTPIQKIIKVSIFGNCNDLPKQLLNSEPKSNSITNSQFKIINNINNQNYTSLQSTTCQLQTTINIQIFQQISPRKQDFSVSASIVVILIVIFLLIIWICLKKYKGLQRQARKVLQAYKKKRSRSTI